MKNSHKLTGTNFCFYAVELFYHSLTVKVKKDLFSAIENKYLNTYYGKQKMDDKQMHQVRQGI